MLPSPVTKSLISCLLKDLITQNGEPDYARYRVVEVIDKRYDDFLDVLKNTEDDLSIIMSLLDRDPDCLDMNPTKKLQALVDYVQIAYALYDNGEKIPPKTTIH